MKNIRAGVVMAVVAAGVAGCGMNMEQQYQKMRANMHAHNYDAAAEFIEKSKTEFYSEKDRLLYYMDKATVLNLGKKYEESNKVLESAKQTAEDLWTESIGENAAAWLTTDNSVAYQGEDFEKVMLHFVAAMNYIGLGDFSGAQVEARQMTNKLELLNSKYEEGPGAYRDDAFSRWLSGKLREVSDPTHEGINGAWIDYKKAITVYETDYAQRYGVTVPRFLIEDALRATAALGGDFKEEHEQLKSRFGAAEFVDPAKRKELAEIIFIHQSGEAPYKIDQFWEADANGETIRIAYPLFVAKPHRIQASRMRVVESNATGTTEAGQPLTAIAIQNLNDHMGRIQAKAVARAIAKYIAAKAAQKGGEALADNNSSLGAALWLAGAVFQVASAVAEEADKRSWITLPSDIWVGRVFTPPGASTVEIEFLDSASNVVERKQFNVEAKAGETSFVTWRTYQ